MITPQPESDLTQNQFVLGSEVIAYLKDDDSMIVEDALSLFMKSDPRRSSEMFLNTLVFLFILELIELEGYRLKLIKNDYSQLSLF